MKSDRISEKTFIRHEMDLARIFRELVREDPDLRWSLTGKTGFLAGGAEDAVDLELDDHRIPFEVMYELKPNVGYVHGLHGLAEGSPGLRPLLVVPELSSRLLAACKELGIAAMDLNGRCWLRAPGLLVDRQALPGRAYAYEHEPKNIFAGRSARIVRCLLADRERVWTQGEIVQRARVSTGLVSRIIQHLIRQGFVAKASTREFRLRDWQALLREWAASDRFAKRTHTTLYTGFGAPPQEFAWRLQQWAKAEKVPLAFTQWIAAWTRFPYTEPVVCSAYVNRLPEQATLDSLGLRQVPEGGKVWLHVPDDEGVFLETQQHHQGLTLASDAQIYLDLQHTGLRGPEAAAALLDSEMIGKP